MSYAYFAWKHDVYECEVLHHLRRDEVSAKTEWYAVVRPSPQQRSWVDAPGMQPNGVVAVPANIVRATREEAQADVAIGALRNFKP